MPTDDIAFDTVLKLDQRMSVFTKKDNRNETRNYLPKFP